MTGLVIVVYNHTPCFDPFTHTMAYMTVRDYIQGYACTDIYMQILFIKLMVLCIHEHIHTIC